MHDILSLIALNVPHSTMSHLSLTNSSCLLHLQSESLNLPSYLHHLWQLLKLTLMFRSQQLTFFLYFMFKCLPKLCPWDSLLFLLIKIWKFQNTLLCSPSYPKPSDMRPSHLVNPSFTGSLI